MALLVDAVGLRAASSGLPVLDAFEREEQFVEVAVVAAAELGAIVGEHGLNPGPVRLKGRQHVGGEQMDGRDRQLVGANPVHDLGRRRLAQVPRPRRPGDQAG